MASHAGRCIAARCSPSILLYFFFRHLSRKKCLFVRILFPSVSFSLPLFFFLVCLADDSRLDPSLNEIPAGFSFCREFPLSRGDPVPLFFIAQLSSRASRCRRRGFCAWARAHHTLSKHASLQCLFPVGQLSRRSLASFCSRFPRIPCPCPLSPKAAVHHVRPPPAPCAQDKKQSSSIHLCTAENKNQSHSFPGQLVWAARAPPIMIHSACTHQRYIMHAACGKRHEMIVTGLEILSATLFPPRRPGAGCK